MPSSAGALQTFGDAVYGHEHNLQQAVAGGAGLRPALAAGFSLLAAASPQLADVAHLQVAERVDIGVAQGYRALQKGVVVQQVLTSGDLENEPARSGVLVFDNGEETSCRPLILRQVVPVIAGDVHVGDRKRGF